MWRRRRVWASRSRWTVLIWGGRGREGGEGGREGGKEERGREEGSDEPTEGVASVVFATRYFSVIPLSTLIYDRESKLNFSEHKFQRFFELKDIISLQENNWY